MQGIVGRGDPGGLEEAQCNNQPVKRAQGLHQMIRFNLCQNCFESFKYASLPSLNKITAATNHEGIIYFVGSIC